MDGKQIVNEVGACVTVAPEDGVVRISVRDGYNVGASIMLSLEEAAELHQALEGVVLHQADAGQG